jgi:hypothetical protein
MSQKVIHEAADVYIKYPIRLTQKEVKQIHLTMSSTLARRYKRQKERDLKKGKVEEYLTIPTKEDVEEYILNKKNESE